MGGSLGARPAVRGPSRVEQAPEASVLSRIPISVITLIAAVGVFVSSMAYAVGRDGGGSSSGSGVALYWVGQVIIVVPIAGRLLSRRQMSNASAVTLIVVLTVAEYLLKVNYGPLGFAFNDEFLHYRGTTDMLMSGKLFETNYGLPIGTYYPGIEEVTSALISATGLPVFEAGLIVAGVAHLLFILFLYLAFCVAIRSHRIAGIALLIYYSAPALTSFNSMFVYETLALAFLGMCMVAALRSAIEKSPADRRRWFIVAVMCIFATVITHHITSYMLTLFLILVAVASRLTGSRNTAVRFGILGAISLVSVICWIAFVAPLTISYFSPTISGIVDGVQALLQKSGSGASPVTATSPFSNTVIGALGILVISALIVIGCWQAWRRHRRHPWIIGMMLGSLGWFVDLGIRLGTPDGQELAGRAATFVYIPVSVLAALALTKLVNSGPVRRLGAAVTAVILASVVSLLIDGLANGWPPFWERLPGPHLVSSFESSVGPEEIAASNWSLKYLGPGKRIASDAGIYPVLIGYGDQNPLQVITELYSTPTWTPAVAQFAAGMNVQFVQTDTRLTTTLPAAGNYFPGDITFATHPIAPAAINKYNNITGVARVYDDGTIRFYDLQAQGYVPQKP
ncbi:MAG TPA: DUF6541 family protein [Trebonia sp.]|jgi:hypothetical protein